MDREVINNLKCLAIDMIDNAKSGHPGIALDAAPILYTLYAKHMNININDQNWCNRDRFVMSSGHGSSLLYATLYMAGYDIAIDDLKSFRRLGKCPGHPEVNVTPGVEVSTGPLGTGFATAVGIALAGKISSQRFSLPRKSKLGRDRTLFNYQTYALVGDGDIMEGITSEAASLAGTWKIDNLIVLYDSNRMSLDGPTTNVNNEDVLQKFEAMGWYTDKVKDGNSVPDIDKAIAKAKGEDRPALIEIETTIGIGSKYQNTKDIHGGALEKDDIEQLKMKLNVPLDSFFINNEAMQFFRKQIQERSGRVYQEWADTYREYESTHNINTIDYLLGKELPFSIPNDIMLPGKDAKEPLRNTNQYIMNKIANEYNYFIGGAADVATSTKTYINDGGDLTKDNYLGRNIHFGVRENAMASILNGLSLCNYKVFGSTFLAFSDYLKPSLRMSALMKLPVTYIFTHDSINIGEDGPTHQPIEQLASLRTIPNTSVFRPADPKELLACWYKIMNTKENPSCLVLPRTEVETLDKSDINSALKGGYIIRKELNSIHAILIATGTEVHTAINIANELFMKYKLDIRVVSMPCRELFEEQSDEYKDSIIPKGYRNIVIEAGSSYGWGDFVYNSNYLITLDRFGISGSKNEVLREMQFSYEDIKARVEKILLK